MSEMSAQHRDLIRAKRLALDNAELILRESIAAWSEEDLMERLKTLLGASEPQLHLMLSLQFRQLTRRYAEQLEQQEQEALME